MIHLPELGSFNNLCGGEGLFFMASLRLYFTCGGNTFVALLGFFMPGLIIFVIGFITSATNPVEGGMTTTGASNIISTLMSAKSNGSITWCM